MKHYSIFIICLIITATLFTGCIQSSQQDSDGDGWTDVQEQKAGTNPYNKDTDGDGYWDSKDENPLDKNIPVSQVVTSVLNKNIKVTNIKSGRDSNPPSNFSIEIRFGYDYIIRKEGMGSSWGESTTKAKITERSTDYSLIVSATDFEEALKQKDYPYWQNWEFKKDGTVAFNDYDRDFFIGEWSIQ